jgi:hypothetical protein
MYTTPLDEANYQYLDQIFLKAGTDKASNCHNYTKIYSWLFNSIKEQSLKFLEIGICYGDSVKGWEEYFPNAELHFMDNNLSQIKYQSTRSQYHFIDQGYAPSLDAFVKESGGNFDIIIDDGGHKSPQIITSFQKLFPTLKSGGIYVIEDLGWCIRPECYTHGERTAFEFIKSLIDHVHHKGNLSGYGGHLNIPKETQAKLNYYQDQIDLIIVQNQLAIITRR